MNDSEYKPSQRFIDYLSGNKGVKNKMIEEEKPIIKCKICGKALNVFPRTIREAENGEEFKSESYGLSITNNFPDPEYYLDMKNKKKYKDCFADGWISACDTMCEDCRDRIHNNIVETVKDIKEETKEEFLTNDEFTQKILDLLINPNGGYITDCGSGGQVNAIAYKRLCEKIKKHPWMWKHFYVG